MKKILLFGILALILASCGSGISVQNPKTSTDSLKTKYEVKLITLDPGHFHAALVQKMMYDDVSPDVHVYAPQGTDIIQHLDIIKSYNKRPVSPTSWNEIVYTGNDFFEKMLSEKAGNVVVLSGNNRRKADYILKSIKAGFNVLADKPLIISIDDYAKLVDAFQVAGEKKTLLYDLMCERYEVTNVLQKLLARKADIFGKLSTGSREEPAVLMTSVHHFSKIVSGTPLLRPVWFFDVDQQGEAIADVSTHLVDLVQWECFPEEIINPEDIQLAGAKRWPISLSLEEFRGVTGNEKYPDFLQKYVNDDKINIYANGEILYQIKGVWAKITAEWKYKAPPGGGDTHFSVLHGTLSDIIIRQTATENYIPTLYVDNIRSADIHDFTLKLKKTLNSLPFDSLQIESVGNSTLKIIIPSKYRISHEEHFGQLTEKFLGYLRQGRLPDWEVAGIITKYFITTNALKMAKNVK